MYTEAKRSQAHAGVAIKLMNGIEKISFHSTGNRPQKGQTLGVWVPLPGESIHYFAKLPYKMTRKEAAEWLLNECKEPWAKTEKIRKFLTHHITKMEIQKFLGGESDGKTLNLGRPRLEYVVKKKRVVKQRKAA